jgi:hypothetical protein
MAESTLSLSYTDLCLAVGYFLGYGATSGSWTQAQVDEIDRAVQSGYRQFLYPPAAQGVEPGYEWSFMAPVATISTAANTADQSLPDDFGRLVDGFTFAAASGYPGVLADVGEGRIRELRQSNVSAGTPRMAGIRATAGTGAIGQRKEVMWYPTPNAVYVLSYKYEACTGKLTSQLPYPLGGLKHAETIRESCLAAAESSINDSQQVHWNLFISMLISSIARDQEEGGRFFGNVGSMGNHLSTSMPYTLTVSGHRVQ